MTRAVSLTNVVCEYEYRREKGGKAMGMSAGDHGNRVVLTRQTHWFGFLLGGERDV